VFGGQQYDETVHFCVWRAAVGESRLLWGGFLIRGGALFHTSRFCALSLRM